MFANTNHSCCGSKMRVHRMVAIACGRDGCYQTRHYVKQCTGWYAASYYLNKMTVRGETDTADVAWCCFYAWTSGDVPEYITNKSGRTIMTS